MAHSGPTGSCSTVMASVTYEANVATDTIGNVALSGTIKSLFMLGTIPANTSEFKDIFVANLAR